MPTNAPPLAHLRRKPGRPRKAKSRHQAIVPRLLDLNATAVYLSVSVWTVRDLEAARVLRRVLVPLAGGRELRKLLFDRADLDRLIEGWKEHTP